MNQVILNTDTIPIIYNLTKDNFHTTKMEPILINSVDVG